MKIGIAHSFLVVPAKHLEEQPEISGTKIELVGKMGGMLQEVFDKSEVECNIDICFTHNSQGQQQNECRDLLIEYAKNPTEPHAKKLAMRLQSYTTRRSGLGLLILVHGKEKGVNRVMVSRFPADFGILADSKAGSLDVKFVEKVFLKKATSYKSVVYSGISFESDFWDGKAVDRQINSVHGEVSDYWIREFLLSDFKTTSAAGTKRIAITLREIAKTATDLDIKEEISAAAKLAKGLKGKRTSFSEFVNRLNLSEEVKGLCKDKLATEALFYEKFEFSSDEFEKHLSYKSVELDSGAVLTASAATFDEVFERTKLPKDAVRFSTEGKIVDQRLKVSK